MFNERKTEHGVLYILLEHLFVFSSTVNGETSEGFMQRTDLTRSVF